VDCFVGNKNATTYAAKDMQGGIAVVIPAWIESFCTSATMQKQTPESTRVESMYLVSGQLCMQITGIC
jgi:hypothetical protein